MIEEFVKKIKSFDIEVKSILDLGSRDLEQSIEFSRAYPNAKIYAFECNPYGIQLCKQKLSTLNNDNIELQEMCVFNYDGIIKFHPINRQKTITSWIDGNPGASSVFVANGQYDHIEKYVQDEIEVNCIRLDTWANKKSIKQIDVIWADLQGAELQAYQGLGDLLDEVKIIHTELEINPMYKDQSLFKDVDPFLKNKGFVRISGDEKTHFGTDFIYINEKFLKN